MYAIDTLLSLTNPSPPVSLQVKKRLNERDCCGLLVFVNGAVALHSCIVSLLGFEE